MKLVKRIDDGKFIGYLFYCPGCKYSHTYEVPRWSFNEDFNNPTFSPSLLVFYTHPETNQRVTCCHLFLKEGKLEFCGDCPHELKGQTVDMVEFPPNYSLPPSYEPVS